MKKLAVLFALALALVSNTGFAIEELNHIVASVNDDVILASELKNREDMIVAQLQQQHAQLPSRDVLRKQVLNRLILENLQLQLAERNGVRIDDETLNKALRNLAAQNGMTLTQFREALEKDGFSYVAFREQLRNQLTMNRIRQQMVDNRVQVTEQEVDNLLATAENYNDQNREYRLAHILVSVPEGASPEQIQKAKKRAEDILARLRKGADFEQMAIAESDGQQALEGGDLGWRKTGQLPSLFTNVVGQLRKGQISDLIRSPSGFHIIKIMDIRGDQRHLIQQTHARHILMRADAMSSEEEVKQRLEQLRERVAEGEDFAKLARANSQDPGSAEKGGDLGWVNPGDMVPEFERAMDKLGKGQVSEPVKSRFGWHLIQVLDRRQHDDTEEYRRARARESLIKLKKDEETEIWLRRLRDEAYVEYYPDQP
ncbi:MAG TPA: molecular chaperone SurA [Gammaproteobacteria bacterium]|nr:molecular chaperone SurA [Gammaproteobacteria bacterium]